MTNNRILVARVYDEPESNEGARVLVDRLWPRGLSKEKADVDIWLKDVAPSGELRRWYGHDAAKKDEFARRYRAELGDDDHVEPLQRLRDLLDESPVILLSATKDLSLSHAAILAEHLKG